ncbi:MAG: aminoglycoside phosphotransferase family protein [Defluviitaleaceae bacterium]|nr:aminoglycoside phosphotransferase family protein [Defluviitaleaceae bacterium]
MIKNDELCTALTKMLEVRIAEAKYTTAEFKVGSVGDVHLIEGLAKTTFGEELPFKIVLKTQDKWLRPGDPSSWRREYDLYISDFCKVLPEHFSWPKCYHATIDGDITQIWMEYAEGISGLELTTDILEKAAYEIGCFQGKVYTQPGLLPSISNFSDTGYLKRDYEQWHNQEYSLDELITDACPLPNGIKQALKDGRIVLCGKSLEYSYLRSGECKIPEHLKQMLYEIDDNLDALFVEISKLPIVLCHRDFFNENIIYIGGIFRLIDWDTSGWGYLGEDVACLISDDIDFDKFEEYCQRLIPAYYKGISKYMDTSQIQKNFIKEMILLKFGYRKVADYMFADNDKERDVPVRELEKLYSMR